MCFLFLLSCAQWTDTGNATKGGSETNPLIDTGESNDSDTNSSDTDEHSALAEGWCPGCNVILVVMDTQPWWTSESMPNMLSAFNDGVILQNHFCGDAWTPACMTSVMAGGNTVDLAEIQGELLGLNGDMAFLPLSDDHSRLAATLQASGYHTSLRSENFYIGEETNLAIGFDVIQNPTNEISSEVAAFAEDIDDLMKNDDPWFATLLVMGAHTPYIDRGQDPATYAACEIDDLPSDVNLEDDRMDASIMENWSAYSDDERAIIKKVTTCAYDAQVSMVDDALWGSSEKGLWGMLNAMGAMENTMVVAISDHGEGFGDVMNPKTGIPGWGHKVNSKSEQTHTIAMIWGKTLAPQEIKTPTDQGDIAPTILASLGLTIPSDFLGAPVWNIPDRNLRTSVCDMAGWPWYAVMNTTTGDRLHRLPDGTDQMFNIFSDPEETAKVSGTDSALKGILDTTVASGKAGHWCGG